MAVTCGWFKVSERHGSQSVICFSFLEMFPSPLSFDQCSLERRDEKKKSIHLATRIMKTLVFEGDRELGV
jgi:hypothetical protein